MISPRYGPIFLVLVGIALIPTLIHGYIGITSDDGRLTNNIAVTLGDFQSKPTDKTAEWVEKRFKSQDWIERQYQDARAPSLLLFVGRSYDPKRLYHHPELALIDGSDFGETKTLRLAAHPDRPIHYLRGRQEDGAALVAYVLLYDGRFVDDPILFQLKTAWQSLFSPKKAMTLFFVSDALPASDIPIEAGRALHLLNLSIESFLSQETAEAG